MDVARGAAYEASPECGERLCTIRYWREAGSLVGYFQHGENPEAVLKVPLLLPSKPEPSSVIRAMFREFAERCHRYDDQVSPPAPLSHD